MATLPTHKAIQMSGCGIFLKEITPFKEEGEPVGYAHRDDYYIFGLIRDGVCTVSIDFKEYRLSKGEVICVQPGQVHLPIQATDLKATLLFVDSLFVNEINRHAIGAYALNGSSVSPDARLFSELGQLLSILSHRIGNIKDDISKEIVRSLSCSVVGMVVEAIQKAGRSPAGNKRQVEITLKFRECLREGLRENRSPSYYAALLNISPVYLNEVINAVTGINVSQYVRNEVVLRAKRLLIYTNGNIQEIAEELGFTDYAYFTRLFTKTTGISPTLFRKRYLE